ncbi:Protein kinase domain-containing protein [Mycena sanguinolenta]|uniref:Protein kinase domain-containing protein n=1 Tax=Mycena sanguinolenta TaxID=230812 RepID=A0A8H6ZG91_9AGAR|nr:Protein kinase domain-containing protein [Mycena sanguinolenta]
MTLTSTPMLPAILSGSTPTQLRTLREQFWVDSYEFLLSRGYQLRPRYHPDWVPSWGPKRHPIGDQCDDFLASYTTNALDALCIKDNQKVVLKRVNEKELKIFRHLDALRSDARNHTIPLLDVVPFPGTDWTAFVVMPYCRRFNSPPFHCRDEFVDAMTQYIEGLQFMHEHNVVHFDIAAQNMVIEESRLIPKRLALVQPGLSLWLSRALFLLEKPLFAPSRSSLLLHRFWLVKAFSGRQGVSADSSDAEDVSDDPRALVDGTVQSLLCRCLSTRVGYEPDNRYLPGPGGFSDCRRKFDC